ncbi:uncharacterized protein [Procambarus clarkii]|uniref:uncharacterized protein n=1 Tax=Procambarus clarkii TaxID=6728 RepID=UPI001E6764ED|nr:uncharacterized protein LOC123767807 [Procambarus clarkii]XP_045613813.1 uncharacterized protein LOC123767807 [Procambarus clarkii]
MCGRRKARAALPGTRLLLLHLLLVSPGNCLRCINCTSLRDASCLEGIGEEQHCTKSENYCVSYTGFLKNGRAQVVFRECAETNMSQFCGEHLERLANNRVEHLVACYYTCDTDLCNVQRMKHFSGAATIAALLPPPPATALVAGLLSLCVRLLLSALL